VALEVHVVGAGHDLRGGHGAADFGDFLGALIDEEDDEDGLGMIFYDGIGDVLEEGRLAGARRGDDEAALAFADRRHEVHDAGRVTVGNGLETETFGGADDGELLEEGEVAVIGGLVSVDGGEAEHLKAAIAAADFAFDPMAVAKGEAADDLGGDEDVSGALDEVALGIAKEAESLAGDFDDAL
jgi:hypothetical protein